MVPRPLCASLLVYVRMITNNTYLIVVRVLRRLKEHLSSYDSQSSVTLTSITDQALSLEQWK